MKGKNKIGISDLISSVGGIIIIALGIGVIVLTSSISSLSPLINCPKLIGAGLGLLFMVICFTSCYYTVNHR